MADAKVVTNTNAQDLSKADLSDKEGHAQKTSIDKKHVVDDQDEKLQVSKQSKEQLTNTHRAPSDQVAQLQQAVIKSWRERASNQQKSYGLQGSEIRSLEQKIHDVKQVSRLAEQVRNMPPNLRNSLPDFFTNDRPSIIMQSIEKTSVQKSEKSWIPKIAKHIPEAVRSIPTAVKGILQPLREKIETVKREEEKQMPKQEVPLQRQIQKDISLLIINKLGENSPNIAPKVASIVKESPELKKLIEHVVNKDSKPAKTAREQFKRLLEESFRISSGGMPTQLTAESLKKLVADTSAKLSAVYGVPTYAEEQVETQEKGHAKGSENAEYSEYEQKIKEGKKLVIQKTYTISGIVMDKFSHKGIEGVFVNAGWMGTAVTNAAGEFSFYNVPEFKVYTMNFLMRDYLFTPSTLTETVDGPNKHYIYGTKA